MNAISYSLFGYKKSFENCYEFESYLRYFTLVIRMNSLLYPGWANVLNIDKATYESEYRPIFDDLEKKGWIVLNKHDLTPELCRAMLWRLEPVNMAFDHVICRDLDSIGCYKEAAAVQVWMDIGNKVAHCMTDSVSHNVCMMGGMVGFNSKFLRDRLQGRSIDSYIERSGLLFEFKGADQDFLNRHILPKISDSITEHYFLGMPQSFRGHCFVGEHIVDDIIVKDIPKNLKETNDLISHIGQAGFILDPVLKFFKRRGILENEIAPIEKEFKNIFHWWL